MTKAIEGIDRAGKSQVTTFVERHGDHSVQHVAYETPDLEKFMEHFEQQHCRLRGESLVREDSHGLVKQVFCKGYEAMDTGEMSFPEYIERPDNANSTEPRVTFSQRSGKDFYQQVEDAQMQGDQQPLVDFSLVPANWSPGDSA